MLTDYGGALARSPAKDTSLPKHRLFWASLASLTLAFLRHRAGIAKSSLPQPQQCQ
jgi:hypothetical protein